MKRTMFKMVFDLLVNVIGSSFFVISPIRRIVYNACGMSISTNKVKTKVYIHSKKVSIGKDSFVNSYAKLFSSDEPGGDITIGENVYIAMNATICTISHEIGSFDKRAGAGKYSPVVLKDGCWIGAGATVLPGVTVGAGSIIAAGSVVTKDCEPNSLYAGVPAKKVKELPIVNSTETLAV